MGWFTKGIIFVIVAMYLFNAALYPRVYNALNDIPGINLFLGEDKIVPMDIQDIITQSKNNVVKLIADNDIMGWVWFFGIALLLIGWLFSS